MKRAALSHSMPDRPQRLFPQAPDGGTLKRGEAGASSSCMARFSAARGAGYPADKLDVFPQTIVVKFGASFDRFLAARHLGKPEYPTTA
jgi:hypothetical protein